MSSEENVIRLLTRNDQTAYNQLLASAFSNPKNFQAREATRVWTPTDDYYPVLGLFHEGVLASMMRVEWIGSDREFLLKYDEKVMPKPIAYPLGYLAKAATLKHQEGRSFNSILRYYSFQIYLNWKVTGVIGFMVEGSPRVNIMKEMGYEFYQKKEKWNGNFQSDSPVLVGELKGEAAIRKALQYLEERFPVDLVMYKLQVDIQNLPMRGRIPFKFPWD